MILIRNLNQINHQLPKTALTIGNFDGIHLGHQTIIKKTIDEAKSQKLKSVILTFEPHPSIFFNHNNSNFNHNFRIYNLATKIKILKNLNPDFLVIIPFNKSFSSISAKEFIENILLKKLNATSLVIGYDFSFGKNRQGDINLLNQYNFNIQQISPQIIANTLETNHQDIIISSSLARDYIKLGKIESLNCILGRNYHIEGKVIEGQKLARNIGFRTANIKPKSHMIQPRFGVYKTRTFIKKYNQYFNSITNFGIKPTLENQCLEPIFETHILNFSQEIYQEKITIEFINFIREEKKFSGLEELKKQIIIDLKSL